jgi:hypothetical protein
MDCGPYSFWRGYCTLIGAISSKKQAREVKMRKKVFAYAVVSLLITVGTISVFSEESQSAIANEADLSVIEPWCTSKPIQRAHDESFETRVYNDGPDDVSKTIEVSILMVILLILAI